MVTLPQKWAVLIRASGRDGVIRLQGKVDSTYQ